MTTMYICKVTDNFLQLFMHNISNTLRPHYNAHSGSQAKTML